MVSPTGMRLIYAYVLAVDVLCDITGRGLKQKNTVEKPYIY